MTTTQQFAYGRRAPTIVLHQVAELPLVRAGGPRINTAELREDFYDVDAVSLRCAGGDCVAPHSVAGEPYSRWV